MNFKASMTIVAVSSGRIFTRDSSRHRSHKNS